MNLAHAKVVGCVVTLYDLLHLFSLNVMMVLPLFIQFSGQSTKNIMQVQLAAADQETNTKPT